MQHPYRLMRSRPVVELSEEDDAPSGIRTRATALKGPRPGPLVDGGPLRRIAAGRPPSRLRSGAVQEEATRRDPHAFVMRCAAEGVAPEDARAELERNGIDAEQARWLVDSAYGLNAEATASEPVAAASEPYAASVLPQALLAGLVAAVVGGIGWTLQVALTDYEVGIVAWAVGGLAGFAVSRAAGRRRGLPLQVVAVAAALLGILLGKYGTFAYSVREGVGELDPGSVPAYWDADLIELFFDELGEVFGAFDLLWVGFAVFTAWRMLQPAR